MITVRFTFSESENRRAMLYVALRSRPAAAMLALGVALLLAGVASARTALIVIGAAELACWLGLIAVMPRVGARRMTASASQQTLSFSDDGVTAMSADGEGSVGWPQWTRWMQTGDLYVLKGARRAVTFVPRRAFASPDAETEFRELLGRHIGSRRLPAGRAGGPAGGRP